MKSTGTKRQHTCKGPVKWDHFKVFVALANRGMRVKNFCLDYSYYVEIYRQEQNEAILYGLDRKNAPLHVKEKLVNGKLWNEIKLVVRKRGRTDPRGFDYYEICDWNKFAECLGLTCSPGRLPEPTEH
jgi:hypothetical protein